MSDSVRRPAVRGLGPRTAARRRPWLAPAIAFLVGLLVGWLLIGWWLWPVRWTNATPADLAPVERQAYVQMVADLHERESGLSDRDVRAAERLAGLDDATLATTVGSLLAKEDDAAARDNLRRMVEALDIAPQAAASPSPTSPTAAAAAPPSASPIAMPGALRALAVAVLAVAGVAALLMSWTWLRTRRRRRGRHRPDLLPPDEHELVADGMLAPAADQPATPADATHEHDDPSFEHGAEGAPQQAFAPPAALDGGTESLALPRRLRHAPGGGERPWRPARVDLGEVARVQYDGDDDRFFQTWLVYDERAGLVGSAGLKAQPVGSVNTLDLWFFERQEEGEPQERPMVTLLSRAALEEPVLRARFGDRRLLAAEPGQTTTLHAGDLRLEVVVEDVESEEPRDELSLRSVRLSLRPERGDPADFTAEDEDADPPAPLPFHRD